MKKRRIYLASSWRNPMQAQAVQMLRNAGHEVYDFRNPSPENTGFAWSEIDPDWLNWTPGQFIDGLTNPIADAGFLSDKAALDWCNTCVLLLPCGRSAHLEAGYAIGQGKPTLIVLSPDQFEPELMYLLADCVVPGINHMLPGLARMRPFYSTYPDKELEYDENGEGLWGCNCGRSGLDRTYHVGPTAEWRVECACGLCGPWGKDEKEACFLWNLVLAGLTGSYSMVELLYRRTIRLARENGQETARFEQMLKGHLEGRALVMHY